MRPGWKRVAESGDNPNFATEAVSAAIIRALELDCIHELPPIFFDALRTICADGENSLFHDHFGSRLETLRAEAVSGMACMVLDEATRLAAAGERGMNVAFKALDGALNDHATRGARQVEEHYLRKSTQPRAQIGRAHV